MPNKDIKLDDAVENLENWMECVRADGDCADVSDGLSEIMGSYPSLDRQAVYNAWRKKYYGNVEFE